MSNAICLVPTWNAANARFLETVAHLHKYNLVFPGPVPEGFDVPHFDEGETMLVSLGDEAPADYEGEIFHAPDREGVSIRRPSAHLELCRELGRAAVFREWLDLLYQVCTTSSQSVKRRGFDGKNVLVLMPPKAICVAEDFEHGKFPISTVLKARLDALQLDLANKQNQLFVGTCSEGKYVVAYSHEGQLAFSAGAPLEEV